MAGLKTTWTLGKIIFPITVIITTLQYTPVIGWIVQWIEPLMKLFGLPGDAAFVLVLGNLLNLYAAIGAILSFDFSVKQVFILAVMLSFSHNLIVESSVAKKVGVSFWLAVSIRVGLAVISAILINLLWHGGSEQAQYSSIAPLQETPETWLGIILAAMKKGILGIISFVKIVIPLMIGIQFLKDYKWLDVFSKWLTPVTRVLGMKENTSMTLAAGFLFGLAFGAGVIIQAVKEDGVSRKDVMLAFIFLVACHAAIEDTLIFIPLGIPVWALFLTRLIVAFILTMIVAIVWKRVDLQARKEATYEH